jgi:mRNA m6A methyltransferase non-catalytic subunit
MNNNLGSRLGSGNCCILSASTHADTRTLLYTLIITTCEGIPRELRMPTATTTQVLSSANDLLAAHATLITRVRQTQKEHRRHLQSIHPSLDILKLPSISSSPPSPAESQTSPPLSPTEPRAHRIRHDLPPAKRARCLRYKNYVPEEETIRNDYSQHYVDSGEWPQNWVLGADPEHRFEEYVEPIISFEVV